MSKPAGFVEDFVRKPGKFPKVTHYCPGCGHGRVHKLIAEAMADLEIGDKTILISPVGCTVFAYYYFDCGNLQAAHGRAPAVATGVGRSNPGSITISYQGDGDLGAIGTAEIIHAANRGEDMTVIFVNNGIYGMTGGQMAPTTLEGQVTSTSPYGRDIRDAGHPMRMAEIIATLEAPVFVERVAVSDSKNIMKARKAIRKALQSQKDGHGFSFVEILSACPIGWKMKPTDAVKRVNDEMAKYFPIQNFKDKIAEHQPYPPRVTTPDNKKIIEVLGVNKDVRLFKKDQKFLDNFKDQNIKIAGFGGQGVLLAGTTIGYLGMETGLNVTWLPSYGPEMRGGTANCNVVLSNKEIGSPMVEHPSALIAMNGPSLEEFGPTVKKDGLIIINSSVVKEEYTKRNDVKKIYIPMNEIAESLGVMAAANMAAVTAFIAATKAFELNHLLELIKHNFKKKHLIEQNIAVINKSYQYVNDTYFK
ncbi:MAG: 2-ketoisovalerate ferredoxin oxidoreductase [Bdellovibrionales bacterium RIFOXYD12_FULL_39_22]|nr:MAG: 2-ketoisovalerate ferredoxin oxidoreductase [Bdellovibrionales bacterium RIFOXYB1_FULL_39_21]OFZ40878.1 MAG: 2-ketoisovalerate ferredoxin oxidoreductase [Bdellovibrionales bacterium RIFOXYC12_FULL_39_17]OFZ44419.1 MAG: 2-ketoisovalerate ferredoxin oxidoreductase [Bdellovibrionales bacterium RIFOXYC1_FULL_39_130]OFZ69062.1 MAG: 2-ketoisovalerate ferredoxin oxidoreductase [Bdellovibrionales bacterium RIFOXYC2_FULL_39_8]OFZ74166.1 MAG: 2-ketoisovalerate ferredoxin oxidoreductase [Bdellovib